MPIAISLSSAGAMDVAKKSDANDVVREGRRLDPELGEVVTLEVDASAKCAGLDLDRNRHGSVRSTQRNASTLLSSHPRWIGVLGYDMRSECAVFLRRPPAYMRREDRFPRAITDADETAIIAWLTRQTDAEFADKKVHKAIQLVALEHGFDPVAQYLESLRWDGRSRLDTWLVEKLGVDPSDYARMVGSKFLISAVARVLLPGCQVDHVLVLEGSQGAGKTTALRKLAGTFHRADPPPLGTRDSKEALRGCWIVEIGELDSMRKSELSAVKNFLSQTEDHYRAPYARRSETHPRRVVFAATTNDAEYLRDHTGNRRFWPVECGAIDLEGLEKDRDQLWAEAVARYSRGEPWHPVTPGERALAADEQDKRVESDPWEDRLAELTTSNSEFTLSCLLERLGVPLDRQGQREKNRVARVLTRFGFRRIQVRQGSRRTHVYKRIAHSDELSPLSPVTLADSEKSGVHLESARVPRDTGDSGDESPKKDGAS